MPHTCLPILHTPPLDSFLKAALGSFWTNRILIGAQCHHLVSSYNVFLKIDEQLISIERENIKTKMVNVRMT